MERVYIDFNNSDQDYGKDAYPIHHATSNIPAEHLKEGNPIILYTTGEMEADAILHFNTEFNVWVGIANENSFRYHMRLEADDRLTREQVKEALRASGISEITEKQDGLLARSPHSRLSLESWEQVTDTQVKTESTRQFPARYQLARMYARAYCAILRHAQGQR